MVSDGDRDLWPDGILSPQIADFRLHCAESKVKPKMAERSGPGVKYGLEKVGKANITLKQKQEDILKIIALTQKDVFAVLNWLRKIVNISNNATLDGLYGFWLETKPREVYCLGGVTAQCLDKGSGNEVKAEWSESV